MKRRTTLLSLLATAIACTTRQSQADDSSMTLKTDSQLQQAQERPQNYMFSEHVTDKVDPHAFIKVQSVVVDSSGKLGTVELRPGTMRIFRADSTSTNDKKRGELRWTIKSEERTTRIKIPGSVIMAVRSLNGVVDWYSLKYDLRC